MSSCAHLAHFSDEETEKSNLVKDQFQTPDSRAQAFTLCCIAYLLQMVKFLKIPLRLIFS